MARPDQREAAMSAQELVDAYKNSGSFDALRKQLLDDFMNSASGDRFLERVDDIIKRKVADLAMSSVQFRTDANHALDDRHHYRPNYDSQIQRSPTGKSKNEFSDQMMRELDRHTAYTRAHEELKTHFLTPSRRARVEARLGQLLEDARTHAQAKLSETSKLYPTET